MSTPETCLTELSLELPPGPKPAGVYRPIVITGNLTFVSGQGPLKNDRTLHVGRVGAEADLQAGRAAAARPAWRCSPRCGPVSALSIASGAS